MRVSLICSRGTALFLSLVVVLGLGLAACSSSGPTSTTSKTPSRAPTFTVPTKSFSSAALGVSFRYPTSWRQG